MGCGSSQEEGVNEVPIAYDPKDIYYDRTGNLRYGHVLNDKEDELRRIIISDLAKLENGGVAYVIDASWMNAWLYFTHYDRNVSPNPGWVLCFCKYSYNSVIIKDRVLIMSL